MTREAAESLGIHALGFLAADPERLGHFLGATGIGPQTIRQAAADPGFLSSVLEHIRSDERLVLAFAEQFGVEPSVIEKAQIILGGAAPEPEAP